MQAIRSQSTNKTFFFFHFARTALRQEKQRLFLHIALGLFFFFFKSRFLNFLCCFICMTGAHSKKGRGNNLRCVAPPTFLRDQSSPSHIGSGFLQPQINKNINSTGNMRAISVAPLPLTLVRNAG